MVLKDPLNNASRRCSISRRVNRDSRDGSRSTRALAIYHEARKSCLWEAKHCRAERKTTRGCTTGVIGSMRGQTQTPVRIRLAPRPLRGKVVLESVELGI